MQVKPTRFIRASNTLIHKCPGSLVAEETTPPDPGNIHSELGTKAHSIANLVVALGGHAADYDTDGDLPEGHLEAIDHAAGVIQQTLEDFKPTVTHFEEKFDMSEALDRPRGTWAGSPDYVLVQGHRAIVIDMKFGLMPVDADSPQLVSYALGVMLRYPNVDTFDLTVVQPRAAQPEFRVKTVRLGREQLQTRLEGMAPTLLAALAGTGKRVAGGHCQYCRAAHTCSANRENLLGAMTQKTKELVSPDRLGDQDIADILRLKGAIEGWLEKVVAEGVRRASEKADCIPGFCLGAKVTHRRWRDDQAVIRHLTSNGYPIDELAPRKLAPPSKVLAAVSPDHTDEIERHVFKPAGTPGLIRTEVAARRKKATAEELAGAIANLSDDIFDC